MPQCPRSKQVCGKLFYLLYPTGFVNIFESWGLILQGSSGLAPSGLKVPGAYTLAHGVDQMFVLSWTCQRAGNPKWLQLPRYSCSPSAIGPQALLGCHAGHANMYIYIYICCSLPTNLNISVHISIVKHFSRRNQPKKQPKQLHKGRCWVL